jgi:hypothetical protein
MFCFTYNQRSDLPTILKPHVRSSVLTGAFTGGSNRLKIISGHHGQSAQYMQIAQNRINTYVIPTDSFNIWTLLIA